MSFIYIFINVSSFVNVNLIKKVKCELHDVHMARIIFRIVANLYTFSSPVLKSRGADVVLTVIRTTHVRINIYYYNSNLIRSAGSRQVDRHGSPDQTRLIYINLLYTLPPSWKYFEINCSTFIY